MAPLFGKSDQPDDRPGGDVATRADIDRLRALPLPQLATEVVAAGFPSADAPDRGRVSVHDIALRLVPGVGRLAQDEIWALEELVGEGLQFLEHASLAQCTVVGTDRRLQWVLTRAGRSAADSGRLLASAPPP